MKETKTNWSQSVTGICIKDGKVLLVRHTYGMSKGILISPGGYINLGESPQEALKREFREETQIEIEPSEIIGVRFNMHDWYIVFLVNYIAGKALSDKKENNEVTWLSIDEALSRRDVAAITKELIKSAILNKHGLKFTEYEENSKYAPYSLFCL